MLPCDGPTVCPPQGAPPQTPLEKFLRFATVGTMLMTAPQVWTIWAAGNVSGVSLVSWAAYLVSSIAWLAYGIKKQDALICFANAGWIGMDLAIIAGIMVRQ
jgi:uncharacterized protein with PQ loop repeat